MRFIPTTATAVEKLKARAKVIKHAEGITLSAAQERAALEGGYTSWHHVRQCLKRPDSGDVVESQEADPFAKVLRETRRYLDFLDRHGTAKVTRFAATADAFHEADIEGHCFRGIFTGDGPAMALYSSRRGGYQRGFVQLGVAEVHYTSRDGIRTESENLGWYVCKYGANEPRIDASQLSDAGRYALLREFGLEIYFSSRAGGAPHDADWMPGLGGWPFYGSPAFGSLRAWARQHPRKVRSFGPSLYLGDWITPATSEANPLDVPEIWMER